MHGLKIEGSIQEITYELNRQINKTINLIIVSLLHLLLLFNK